MGLLIALYLPSSPSWSVTGLSHPVNCTGLSQDGPSKLSWLVTGFQCSVSCTGFSRIGPAGRSFTQNLPQQSVTLACEKNMVATRQFLLLFFAQNINCDVLIGRSCRMIELFMPGCVT